MKVVEIIKEDKALPETIEECDEYISCIHCFLNMESGSGEFSRNKCSYRKFMKFIGNKQNIYHFIEKVTEDPTEDKKLTINDFKFKFNRAETSNVNLSRTELSEII